MAGLAAGADLVDPQSTFRNPHSEIPLPVPTLPVTPAELVIAFVLVTIGSAVQGSIGFGLAVVSAPVLLLLNSVFIPGPLLLAAMLLVVLIAHRDRAAVLARDVPLGIVGRVLGTIPAAYALTLLSAHGYDMLFAGIVLLAVVLSVSGWHVRPTPANVVAAATLSGFAGTVSSLGGAPMALVYQAESGPRIRGTLSTIFVAGTLISITGLWWAGRFGLVELLVGLGLMPGIVVGFTLSRYTARRIDQVPIRPLILLVSALSGVAILVRAFFRNSLP